MMAEFFGIPPDELTTVDTRVDLAATEMVRILQDARAGNSTHGPSVIAIQPKLVIGRSTFGDRYKAARDEQDRQDRQDQSGNAAPPPKLGA
jgi:hypothetical protein